MNRIETCAALAGALILAACNPEPTPPATAPANDVQIETGTAPAVNGAQDSKPPVELTPEAERGETGARDLLLDFARAIELGRFGEAWALLSPADKRNLSAAQFTAMFADLGKITVAVPTGRLEGAAGSSYYTAPITITANDKAGRPVRYEGEAVLRRSNAVDGATPAQRRWHFETLKLDWTH
jgi:hypothetical protein